MRLTVVGSGTLWPDGTRSSAAHYVDTGAGAVLLDCGSGAVHGMARLGLAWQDITHIAITHFHTDHVGDLPALFWAYRVGLGAEGRGPLTVLGPPGIQRFMRRLARAFGPFIVEPAFDLEIVELGREDGWEDPSGHLAIATHPTVHTKRSVAYRLSSGPSLGYTGDAGPDDALYRFFTGSDAVLAECAQPDPPALTTHLSPGGLADLGRIAAPGVLVATHVYPPLDPNDVPGMVRAAGWDGQVIAAFDGLALSVAGA